jgi:hypothetical protein
MPVWEGKRHLVQVHRYRAGYGPSAEIGSYSKIFMNLHEKTIFVLTILVIALIAFVSIFITSVPLSRYSSKEQNFCRVRKRDLFI